MNRIIFDINFVMFLHDQMYKVLSHEIFFSFTDMFMSIMSQYEICYCLLPSKHCSRFIINMQLLWINLISSSNNLGCWTFFSYKTVYKDTILRKKMIPSEYRVSFLGIIELHASGYHMEQGFLRNCMKQAWTTP